MEIAEAIRIAYKAALSNIVIGSTPIKVFGLGSIVENQKPPYIIISTFTVRQRLIDRSKVFECTQLVDIVTSSLSPSGFGQAMNIANQVETAINPDSSVNLNLTLNGYRIGDTNMIETNSISDKSNTEYIYRVLKRYRHLISKQ